MTGLLTLTEITPGVLRVMHSATEVSVMICDDRQPDCELTLKAVRDALTVLSFEVERAEAP